MMVFSRARMMFIFSAFALSLAQRAAAQDYKAYQNYDFVAGDRIVFDDDFQSDKDGEFPAHWKLDAGQGVVNEMNGSRVFALVEGNYATVEPRMTAKSYLGDTFTIEFDTYPKSDSTLVVFLHGGDDEDRNIHIGTDVSTEGLEHDLTATNHAEEDSWYDKWHHIAIAYTKGQVKVYEDQYRVLVAPDFAFKPDSVRIGGIGSADAPVLLRTVRIAAGGGANLIDALTKNGRIVTHGILFDVNSSAVKPESMGTISELAKALKSDASIKVEIGGHTDADGDASKNMTLSQQRADAVKKLLVDQGIDGARMTTKGYGSTRPIDKNDTPEGKANNRRVELVATRG